MGVQLPSLLAESSVSRKGPEVQREWLELFPYGVTFNLDGFASPQHPVMFFKNEDESQVLPVRLSPLDAGIALFQQEEGGVGPYGLVWKLLNSLGCQLEKCLFVDLKGYQLYVELYFSGDKVMEPMVSRADEIISFCLSSKAKFYASQDLIERCRTLSKDEALGYQMMEGGGLEESERPTYLN